MKKDNEHKRRPGFQILFLGIAGLFFLLLTACREYELKSGWLDRDVKIDGETGDWLGRLAFVEDEMVSIGMMNDGNHLTICLISENRERQAQIFQQGMTIWFSKNKEPGRLGLRFPLGMAEIRREQEGNGMEKGSSEGRPGETSGRLPGRDSSAENRREERIPRELPEEMAKIFSAVEIYVPEADKPVRLTLEELTGIEIGLDRKSGLFSYELRMPLTRSEEEPYGIDARPGETIIVEIDVPKMEMGEGGRNMGGAGRPIGGGRGGMEGGRGGMGGGMGGGRIGGMAGRPDRPGSKFLKLRISVHLAAENQKY